ncbi:MAG: hypothetical protein QXH24_04165 [Candidatus Bathyarchaeia archaeon]
MPIYEDATYGGQSTVLENSFIRLEIHNRVTGWGYIEVFDSNGRMIAVVDSLAEVKLPALDIPLRLEAQTFKVEDYETFRRLSFPVKLTGLNEMLERTAFKRWFRSPITEPVMEGCVTITLDTKRPLFYMIYDLKALAMLPVKYIRAPWVKVGANSFGSAKSDGIFPGVEWLIDDEWSSGTDYFQHPWALRVSPHPFKVSIPVMALSYDGTGIGLAWDPLERVIGYRRYPQPVYASPNFIDRKNNHIMGLMLPSAAWGVLKENTLEADPPFILGANQSIHLKAEIFLVKGNSLDVIVDWVRRHKLPEPPKPRYPLLEALDRIAQAYNSNLWRDNEGWGSVIFGRFAPIEPPFLERYIKENYDRKIAKELLEKVEWARKQPNYDISGYAIKRRFSLWSREKQLEYAHKILSYQRDDGSFPFEPDGRHSMPDHFNFSEATYKPLGRKGDTALDLCVEPAIYLLVLAGLTGEESLREAARKALDYCISMKRPEGGDWWETPLHSPNLLAAGHAAIAYYLGYKAFRDRRYLEKAIYWIRSLLPFTHLWEPYEVPQIYNTKPCFCATDWWLANWVDNHVQWEVLQTFAMSYHLGIDWDEIDPEIGWHHYHKGITTAVLRWMIDHEDIVNTTYPLELVKSGALDTLYADSHNCVTGIYGGGPIMPDVIADNIYAVLDKEAKIRQQSVK